MMEYAGVLRRDDGAVRGGCFRRETAQEGAGGRAGGIAGEGVRVETGVRVRKDKKVAKGVTILDTIPE